jgi:hypothetical protein
MQSFLVWSRYRIPVRRLARYSGPIEGPAVRIDQADSGGWMAAAGAVRSSSEPVGTLPSEEQASKVRECWWRGWYEDVRGNPRYVKVF